MPQSSPLRPMFPPAAQPISDGNSSSPWRKSHTSSSLQPWFESGLQSISGSSQQPLTSPPSLLPASALLVPASAPVRHTPNVPRAGSSATQRSLAEQSRSVQQSFRQTPRSSRSASLRSEEHTSELQ